MAQGSVCQTGAEQRAYRRRHGGEIEEGIRVFWEKEYFVRAWPWVSCQYKLISAHYCNKLNLVARLRSIRGPLAVVYEAH